MSTNHSHDQKECSLHSDPKLFQFIGQQVRECVETIIDQINCTYQCNPRFLDELIITTEDVYPKKQVINRIYQVICQTILRLAIISCAEVLGLLPIKEHTYSVRYSLSGLCLQLQEKLTKDDKQNFASRFDGWVRVLRLFQIMVEGLDEQELHIPAYGGQLFTSIDGISNASTAGDLSDFDSSCVQIDNCHLSRILTGLNFEDILTAEDECYPKSNNSDLSLQCIEYLGIIHESMLDYHLSVVESKDGGVSSLELCLNEWDRNRKGMGAFYTRWELAWHTVRHTLEPLVYEKDSVGKLIPRLPEEILSLKVCDPACGSGSFLITTLKYLLQSLQRSVEYHQRLRISEQQIILSLTGEEDVIQIQSPIPEQRDSLLRKIYCFQITQNCLYGVDINPLAVELAKVSLWMETGDPDLAFSFVDHRLKTGNSLLGCWSDYYQEYPILAWARDGGDTGHCGVHYQKGQWNKEITDFLKRRIKPEMVKLIQGGQEHILVGHEDLREAFDTWCAIWFWPADQLNQDTPTPLNFRNLSAKASEMVKALREKWGFFHWELEFPEVFQGKDAGFTALVGNPPWEVTKPKSQEFFLKYDSLYRKYGKQKGLKIQKKLFQQPQIERDWLAYLAGFKALTNFINTVAHPFGDCKINGVNRLNLLSRKQWSHSHSLHRQWREGRQQRNPGAEDYHPYRYQGTADLNMYKIFLEMSLYILKQGGRLGMIFPSSIYTDKGCTELRKYLLQKNDWELLFGFENRKGIFPIDARFKFCVIVLVKGGTTEKILTSFMRHELKELQNIGEFCIPYPKKQVQTFSPSSIACLEIRSVRDQEILEKMYSTGVLLGEKSNGWDIQFNREFDMTLDSALFSTLSQIKDLGYQLDQYGYWIGPDKEVALPLYEGRMIGQFDFSAKGWLAGRGRSSRWQDIPIESKRIQPQYLVALSALDKERLMGIKGLKLPLMNITSATNSRTVIGSLLRDYPCNNALNAVRVTGQKERLYHLAAYFNSFSYDYLVRQRLGGLNLNFFILDETVIPPIGSMKRVSLLPIYVARLNLIHECFAVEWLELVRKYPEIKVNSWRSLWALTDHERLRLRCIIDAIVAELYGLDWSDLAWILRNDSTDLKGFWRIDEDRPEKMCHTYLTLEAFHYLKKVGLQEFCQGQWQLPSEIVNELGPALLPQQANEDVESSWRDCELHARNYVKSLG